LTRATAVARPNPKAETDGGDDDRFHRAYPRGDNIDLRQVCRDAMSGHGMPPKGLVCCTADYTCDEPMHGTLLLGTSIEEERAKRSAVKAKLNVGLG
jgi:hypothetical protein